MSEAAVGSRTPLVSIGIPTFNRFELLERTIDDARSQTYPNLEIIVSDNASTDPRVQAVCREAEKLDPRIRYVRQRTNIGPMPNFEFTLTASSGVYFIWFADDDRRKPTFIEDLMRGFSTTNRPTALICLEAQYETPEGLFPYFAEAIHFYGGIEGSALDRIRTVMQCAPGNIIYGLFRRECLFHDGVPLTRWIGSSLNELPFFVLVAAKGDIVCMPEIGFWKRAPWCVCRGAMWEQSGGFNRNGPQFNLPGVIKYHWTVLAEIGRAIDALDLSDTDRRALKRFARRRLATHALAYALGWKPSRAGT